MKLIADPALCVGAGQCVLTEPSLFDQNPDDGTVVLLNDQPADDLIQAAREAVHVCPSQALSLTD